MFYDKFVRLCNEKGIKPTPAALEAGISKSLVSKWKSQKIETPSMEVLSKLAAYFGIPVSELLEENSCIVRCDKCSFAYDSNNPEDVEAHRIRHLNFELSMDKFGFYWDPIFREKNKAVARTVVNDCSRSLEERIDAQIIIFKALFSRSLMQNHFGLDHPNFESYVSMLLLQGKSKHSIPEELYDHLVGKFGVKEGIPVGTIYQKIIPPASSKANRGSSVLDILTENEFQLVCQYAERLINSRPK